jgi:uncharacterized ion transporter superfamily protein YfcC
MITARASSTRRQGYLNPVLIMLAMLLVAALLTYLVPAGRFNHRAGVVIPGSYHVVSKVSGLPALLARTPPVETDSPARAAGVVALFMAIPAGMIKSGSLIFMVMFLGGMFGVLRATGAIDAGVDRLLHVSSGNVYLLATGLMLLLACGATFLGFISEYLVIIPLVSEMGERLKLPNLFAPAVVVVASMIGWDASVTNPLALTVVQPLAGVPIFSGFLPRFGIFAAMFALGLAYVLLYLRRLPKTDHVPEETHLTRRQVGVLMSVVLGGMALVIGTGLWSWGSAELAAAFVAFGVILGLVGGLRAGTAANAFVDGMAGMLLAALMLGLASSMEIILQSSQITDSMIHGFATLIQGHTRSVVAEGMMAAEMMFGVLIHSVLPKAAISMPILTPIAHLSGVSGQVTVTATLLGSGLINMISPTNGVLLAFLAVSKVDYVEWIRFTVPLFCLLCITAVVALYVLTALGT